LRYVSVDLTAYNSTATPSKPNVAIEHTLSQFKISGSSQNLYDTGVCNIQEHHTEVSGKHDQKVHS